MRPALLPTESRKESSTFLRKIILSNSRLFAVKIEKYNFLFHLVLVAIAFMFYLLSLKKCPHDSNEKCLLWLFNQKNIYPIAFYTLASGLIFAYLNFAVLISKTLPCYFFILIILPTLTFLFQISSKTSWKDHGGLNQKLIILIQILTFCNYLIWKVFEFLTFMVSLKQKTSVTKVRLFIFTILVIFVCCYSSAQQYYGKSNYFKMVNPLISPSEADKSDCKIRQPKLFFFDVIRGLLKVSALSSCRSSYDISWVPGNLKLASVIGFPLLTKVPKSIAASVSKLAYYSRYNVSDCSDQRNCNSTESFLLLNESKPQFRVRVVRNETLVNERRQFISKTHAPPNILVIVIDALSRSAFSRSMPKSFAVLESWNKQGPNLNIVPYLKFSSMGLYTDPNIFPLFYGVKHVTVRYVVDHVF